jgi:DNA primase
VDTSFRDNDVKARVLEATDIVDLVGRSVALTRRGKDFVGLCPFHQEKTPSFHVSQAKQFFYCYGCKKHGNALDFVIERDRVEFKDALRILAQAAGITMPKQDAARYGEMQVLRDIQSAACMYFEKQLAHPTIGQAARDYLHTRGVTDESVKLFRLGMAVDAWDGFASSPAAKKFAPAQLALAGLVKPRQQGEGHYDTFRNRLMFPIRDVEGRAIAFGGRILPGNDDNAKYLNSPQTPLFDKGTCAFGLDMAKEKIIETRTVAVVEGYTDVVMAHQCGCRNVVSTLGTALTPRHMALLRRFADRVVLLFDPDEAGDLAVDRAVELFLTQDKVEISIATLPNGMDPDEYLLNHGAAAFDAILTNAADALTYKWKQLVRQFAQSNDDLTGQQKAVSQYMAVLASARQNGAVDPIRWGAALSRVSRLTEIPAAELHRRFKAAKPERRAVRTKENGPQTPKTTPRSNTACDKAEAFVLGYLLCEPPRWADVQQHLQPEDFTDGPRRKLAEIYWQHQQDEGEPVFNQFLDLLIDASVKELAVELAQQASAEPEPELSLNRGLEYLRHLRSRSQQDRLEAQLRGGTHQGSPDGFLDEVALLQQISESCKVPDQRRGIAGSYGV